MRKYMFVLMALLTPVLLSVPAYASEVDSGRSEGSFGGGRSSVTQAMGDVVDVMGQVWEVMVSNPLLVVFLAASLFAVGVRIFRKVKRAAKG